MTLAEIQATIGSDYWQARGCEAARAEGLGFASEKAYFGATNIQSGTDLVGADWERRLGASPPRNSQLATRNFRLLYIKE